MQCDARFGRNRARIGQTKAERGQNDGKNQDHFLHGKAFADAGARPEPEAE
jgi:hypothetical protein